MKNKKLLVIIATALMVCLVMGMGAMTFAKYITSTKTEDQKATAAQWGFVISVDASNLFGDAYTGTDGNPSEIKPYDQGVSIKATTEEKLIVAPGSKGSLTILISGKAEVRAALSIKQTEGSNLSDIHIVNYNSSELNYYPLVWTLKDGETVVDFNGDEEGLGGNQGRLSNVIAGLVGTSATLEANTEYIKNYTLSWEWPLGQGADEATKKLNNTYDTIIGFKNAERDWADIKAYVGDLKESEYTSIDNIITAINFALDISVTQVQ